MFLYGNWYKFLFTKKNRLYTVSEYQKQGIGAEVLRRLEALAKIKGYCWCILETGNSLTAAMHMYKRAGYREISNYGQYADMSESVCMSKKI